MNPEEYMPLIRRALADFDFATVHQVMTSLDWKWSEQGEADIPTIGKLYQHAEKLLIRAAEKQCAVSSGGFQAYADKTSVELCFAIAESSCSIYELEEETK